MTRRSRTCQSSGRSSTGPSGPSPRVERGSCTSSRTRSTTALDNAAPHHLLALARPAGAGADDRSALPVAGDDPGATAVARHLLDALGFDTVDLGRLAESWRSEPNTPLYALPHAGAVPDGLDLPGLLAWFQSSPGAPLPAAEVERLAAAAVRGPAGVRS